MRRMLADMPLSELFEWYEHFTDMYEPSEATPTTAPANAVCTSVDEEISMMRAMMGG